MQYCSVGIDLAEGTIRLETTMSRAGDQPAHLADPWELEKAAVYVVNLDGRQHMADSGDAAKALAYAWWDELCDEADDE